MEQWLKAATRADVVKRSLRVAAVVGTILVMINYSDRLIGGTVSSVDAIKMALTYLVPYCVSTYASVSAILKTKS